MTGKVSPTTQTHHKQQKERNLTLIKIFYITCYAIVPLFFVIFYIFMTKTYEDILHTRWHYHQALPDIFSHVYHFIPRLGEFYQRIVMQFMTTQVSFGFDLCFRLLTAAMSAGLIYALTAFVLRRRPKLQWKDIIIYLGLFIALMGFEMAEVFLYRFSYVHNYILATLVFVVFLLPYRFASRSNNPFAYIGMLILGFLLGISTEITPIAVLIVLIGLAIYLKISKTLTWKEFWRCYHLQITGVIGIIFGLLFFYLGAGLSARTGGAYSEIYDYISLGGLFSNPIKTFGKIIWHAWYNIRYLTFGLIFVLFILLHEFVQANKTHNHGRFALQCSLFAFDILFIGAASLIKVHDDLYPRFMMPVYIAIFASIAIFFYQNYLNFSQKTPKVFRFIGIALAVISLIMTVDMSYGIASYFKAIRPIVSENVNIDADEFIRIDPTNTYDMTPSPLFKFVQLTPFDWGPTQSSYLKYGTKAGHFCHNLPSCAIMEQ